MSLTPNEDALTRIEARLDRMEAVLERLSHLLDHGASAIPMAFDTADELVARAQARGVDVDARLNAAVSAVEQLTEPRTMEAIGRLAGQAERLEPIAALAAGFEDTTAMAFDVADEWARDAATRGVDVDQRLAAAARLLEQLTHPRTLDALGRIARQAERLEPITTLAAGFEDTTAMAFDIADEWTRQAAERGIDVDERLRAALGAVERLTDPEVIRTLDALLGYAPMARAAAEYGHALPGYVAIAFDTFDDLQSDALAKGFDLEEAVVAWMRVIRQLGDLTATPALQTLLSSALLEPRTIRLTAEIGEALARTLNENPQPVGMWGAFTGFNDPKVQKATGFLLAWARHIGGALETSSALAPRD